MKCPRCGKKTIRRYGNRVFLTNPPIYEAENWCGCGWHSGFKKEQQKSEEEILREAWEKVNG